MQASGLSSFLVNAVIIINYDADNNIIFLIAIITVLTLLVMIILALFQFSIYRFSTSCDSNHVQPFSEAMFQFVRVFGREQVL